VAGLSACTTVDSIVVAGAHGSPLLALKSVAGLMMSGLAAGQVTIKTLVEPCARHLCPAMCVAPPPSTCHSYRRRIGSLSVPCETQVMPRALLYRRAALAATHAHGLPDETLVALSNLHSRHSIHAREHNLEERKMSKGCQDRPAARPRHRRALHMHMNARERICSGGPNWSPSFCFSCYISCDASDGAMARPVNRPSWLMMPCPMCTTRVSLTS
jgi:hypothetical protein